MAHLLVTQVSQEDEQKRQAPAPAATPKKAPAKPKHGWCWQIFCCSSSADDVQDDQQPISPSAGNDRKETPKAAPPRESVGPSPVPASGVEQDGKESEGDPQWLLDPLNDEQKKANKKTLVLDLDETLVHSSFTWIPDADFIIDIELDGAVYKVYVRKRPGVDEFLKAVGEKFEVVIFTASLAKYADPLLDILDQSKVVSKRLFREACVQHYGNYVKDLSLLGRKMENSIIVDNSPFSYMFQPDNAIPITSWFNDKADTQLYDLLPFLDRLMEVEDVSTLLAQKSA